MPVSYTHLDVYKRQPLEECERRDVKGLYAKARSGAIPEFTGITAPFEEPEHPELRLDTTHLSVEECVRRIVRAITPIISIDPKSCY